MNFLFMAKETKSSVPSLKYLLARGQNVVFAVIRSSDVRLRSICERAEIPYGSESVFLSQQENLPKIDYLLSYYWKLIKEPILGLARYGCINFHPGPLPEARGSGYHAAILEEWGYWGVTAHWMDSTFDTGRIIECNRFPIPAHIVNYDLVRLAHEQLYALFCVILNRILEGDKLPEESQSEGRYFSLADMESGKRIKSEDTSELIARKIRAYWHPPYMGANITINGKAYALLDEQMLTYIAKQLNTFAPPQRTAGIRRYPSCEWRQAA